MKKEISNLKSKMHEDLIAETEKLKRNYDSKLGKDLEDKETLLRIQLEREYKAKLEEGMRKNEIKLEEKKAQLEKHITEQAKKLLN